MNAAVNMNRSAASTPTNGQLGQCRRRDFLSKVISSQYHVLCGSEPEPHACDKARGGGILAICSCEVGGPARLRIVGHADIGSELPGDFRSEERRGGKECVSTCRSREAPSHKKKQKT